MSRYAWLVCEDSKQFMWLGKICTDPATNQTFFHIGDESELPNSCNALLMKAMMKFLASNIGKTIRLWPEEVFDTRIEESYFEIGGDGEQSISFENYVEHFPG